MNMKIWGAFLVAGLSWSGISARAELKDDGMGPIVFGPLAQQMINHNGCALVAAHATVERLLQDAADSGKDLNTIEIESIVKRAGAPEYSVRANNQTYKVDISCTATATPVGSP